MVLRGLSRPGLPGHHLACPTSSGRGRVATLGPREFVWYPQQPTNGKHYINACEAGWRWEVQDLAERKQELWPRAEPQRGLRLGEELPCREQGGGGCHLRKRWCRMSPSNRSSSRLRTTMCSGRSSALIHSISTCGPQRLLTRGRCPPDPSP